LSFLAALALSEQQPLPFLQQLFSFTPFLSCANETPLIKKAAVAKMKIFL